MHRRFSSWAIIWALLAIVLVIRTGVRDRGVIIDHLEFGRRVVAAEDLYAPYLDGERPLHPVYPPSFGLMTWPFTLLGETGARFAWGIFQVLSLWSIGLVLLGWLRSLAPPLAGRAHWILACTALLGSRYILRDTHGGGGNLINLALALLAIRMAQEERAKTAMLLLGFSLATKPTTILFTPFLFLLGYRKVAVGSIAVFIACLGLATILNGHGLAPLERWIRGSLAYGSMENVFDEPFLGLPPFSWMNQCLRCMLARYLGTVPEHFAQQVPGFFQGAGLEFSLIAWIGRLCNLCLLAFTFIWTWRRRHDPLSRPALIAAMFAMSLLMSPISWKAHHVALLPAFFLLVVRAFQGSLMARNCAVAYFFACVAGGGDIVGRGTKEVQQSLYLVTFGTIALWVTCLKWSLSSTLWPSKSTHQKHTNKETR